MKHYAFTFYGLLIGAVFAIFGGIFFGAIPAATIFELPDEIKDIHEQEEIEYED